jgi:hypothetical protein
VSLLWNVLLRGGALPPLLLLAACGAERADGHAGGDGEPGVAWNVVTPAALRIGTAQDGSDALFFVTAAARLAHGDILVADAGNHRVDVFNASGKKVRSLGRQGRGPGEFSQPSWLGFRGDTVLVWDMVQARLTRFDTAGTLIGTDPPVTDLGSFPRVAGQRDDGSLLAVASESADWRAGAHRDLLLIVWMRPDGGRDTVATVPGDEQFGTRSPDRRVTETTTLPFGRRTVVSTHRGNVFLGTADSPVIVASPGGTEWDTVASLPGPLRPVAPKDVDDYWARLRVTGARAPLRPPEGMAYPTHYPPYTDLQIAPDGDVWASLPSRPSEWSVSSRWLVFSPEGKLRGNVEIPGRNRMLQVGDGWILVAETDADDREIVVRYTLSGS